MEKDRQYGGARTVEGHEGSGGSCGSPRRLSGHGNLMIDKVYMLPASTDPTPAAGATSGIVASGGSLAAFGSRILNDLPVQAACPFESAFPRHRQQRSRMIRGYIGNTRRAGLAILDYLVVGWRRAAQLRSAWTSFVALPASERTAGERGNAASWYDTRVGLSDSREHDPTLLGSWT